MNWNNVCGAVGVQQQVVPDRFCAPVEDEALSPIESYYKFSEYILTLGNAADLAASPALGRLLLLGLVSGAEGYYRAILAGALRICPLSRKLAAEQQLTLSSLDYYGLDEVELALFDRVSLASQKELRAWTKRLTGLEFADRSPVGTSIAQFDLICHLRHAAVHAQGFLGSGNVRELGLAAAGRHIVDLDFAGLQQVGSVCHAAVRSYNLWLFEALVMRWNSANHLNRIWVEAPWVLRRLVGLGSQAAVA